MEKHIKESTVKWGIIGVGDVCEVKSAPAMSKIEGSELVAVMRRNTEKAKDYARRHKVPRWYDDADQLINDPEVNAIYIATPPHVHAHYVEKAAEAGKPVYIEKPMARSYAECTRMIKACERHNVPLFVAYYRRTLPNFLKVKQLIEQGAIGDVRLVHIQLYESLQAKIVADSEDNWRVDPEIAGGGYFYDLASHQLDFLDYVFGPVKEAKGFSANQGGLYSANDIVIGNFSFESGVLGTGSWCFTTSEISEIDKTTIVGSTGQITYPTFNRRYVLLEKEGKEPQRFEFEMPEHIQQPLIEKVVGVLLGRGECPSTGKTAARTNRVMEKIVHNF